MSAFQVRYSQADYTQADRGRNQSPPVKLPCDKCGGNQPDKGDQKCESGLSLVDLGPCSFLDGIHADQSMHPNYREHQAAMQQYNQDERNPRLGLLIILLTNVVFWGTVYKIVEWLHP